MDSHAANLEKLGRSSTLAEGIFSRISGIMEMAELVEIAKLLYQTTQEHYTLVVGRLCN